MAQEKTPIPSVKKDDAEDVSWALSTADAMWNRGDQADALKWVRRAAEAASEAEADDRALELAKAAADIAQKIGPIPQTVPPPAPPRQVGPMTSRPPPPPAAARPVPKPPPTPPLKPLTASVPLKTPPKPPPATPKGTPVRAAAVPQPRESTAPVSKRGGRKSSANLDHEVRKSKPDKAEVAISDTPETRRARRSKPSPDEMRPTTPGPIPADVTRRLPPLAEEMDNWPTQSLHGEDLEASDDKTRIGTPAYTENAKTASQAPPPIPLKTAQAVRVIVWRAADGVHVAPHGTTVAAISVDAMLVALDPTADLAAWLGGK